MQFSRKSYHFRCQGMDVVTNAAPVGHVTQPSQQTPLQLAMTHHQGCLLVSICPVPLNVQHRETWNLKPTISPSAVGKGQFSDNIFAVLGRWIFMVLFVCVCVCGCNSHQPRLSGEKGKDHKFRVGDELFNPKKGSYCSLRENSHGPIALYK